MPAYEFRCPSCGARQTVRRAIPPTLPPACPACLFADTRRVFSFRYNKPMVEHVSHITGTAISSEKQLARELKAAGEKASIETGVPHNYIVVDPNDSRIKATDEGMEPTHRAQRASGQTEAKFISHS